MKAIIGLIILIVDIIAILEVVKSQFSTGKKVLWRLVILLLPVIGLVLYYLIGRKK